MSNVTRRGFLSSVAASAAASALGCGLGGRDWEPRPEHPRVFIWIETDGEGTWSLPWNDPNTQGLRPSIQRLWDTGGVVNTQCYAHQPLCTPSRAGSLTGLQTYCGPNPNGAVCNDLLMTTPASQCLPGILSDFGFTTGGIGKLHTRGGGKAMREKFIPPGELRVGIKDMFRMVGCVHNPKPGKSLCWDEQGNKFYWPGYDATGQTDFAISWIRDQITQNPDVPLFLYLNWSGPHQPWKTVPQEFQAYFPPTSLVDYRPNVPSGKWPSVAANLQGYYGHTLALDYNLGRLLDLLDVELGIGEDSLLVYKADHGEMGGTQGCLFPNQQAAKYGKQMADVESAGTPSIWRWRRKLDVRRMNPQLVNPDGSISVPMNNVDFLPTVLGLMGMEKLIPGGVHGRNLAPYLTSHRMLPDHHGALVSSPIPSGGGFGYEPFRCFYGQDYMVVMDLQGEIRGIYANDGSDPYQLNNLAGTSTALDKKMEQRLDWALNKAGDTFESPQDIMTRMNLTWDGKDVVAL